MNRKMSLWYGKEMPEFVTLNDDYSKLEIIRIAGGLVCMHIVVILYIIEDYIHIFHALKRRSHCYFIMSN